MGKQYLNGVLYGTGEIIKFSPNIYSLSEREIGVWINGKPLYEITIDCGNAPNNSTANYSTGLSNVETIFIVDGFLFDSPSTSSLPLNLVRPEDSTYSNGCLLTSSTNIRVITKYDRSSYEVYVRVRYTKTTDVPGSGHYTTTGGEAHHYSTSEQVVGTWVDGSTLYEKTIYYDNQDGITDTSQHDYEIATIQNIVLINSSGTVVNNTTGNSYGIPYSVGSKGVTVVYKSNSTLYLRSIGDTWSNNWKFYITIQYIKVTP